MGDGYPGGRDTGTRAHPGGSLCTAGHTCSREVPGTAQAARGAGGVSVLGVSPGHRAVVTLPEQGWDQTGHRAYRLLPICDSLSLWANSLLWLGYLIYLYLSLFVHLRLLSFD